MNLQLESAALSHIGNRRHDNQDRFLVLDRERLFAVADGMGGLPFGAEAAEAALAALERSFQKTPPASPDAWRRLVMDINLEIVALGQQLSPVMGIGTTFTLVRLTGNRFVAVHVGDSAVFRLRHGQFVQLTPEHTVAARVQAQRAAGRWVASPPDSGHILTSCLGHDALEEIDVQEHEIQGSDRYLLCTDGLTKPVPLREIGKTLGAASSPGEAAQKLVDLANAWGGPDNATAIAIFCAAS